LPFVKGHKNKAYLPVHIKKQDTFEKLLGLTATC